MNIARNFREYQMWQDAVELATYIYKITNGMPWFEKNGLCDQLQRAVVSIASNIAEGAGRSSTTDFAHFLDLALGSCNEVETQIIIAKNIGYVDEEVYNEVTTKIRHISAQLIRFTKSMRTGK